jgi:hypothetical protein
MGDNASATFLGPFANALQVSSSYQSQLDNYWRTMMNKNGEWYFGSSMRLITGLLASGNMPNFMALAGDLTPIALPSQTGGHMGPPIPQYFDMRGNKIHGMPQTPGIYIVRHGSQTTTHVVR